MWECDINRDKCDSVYNVNILTSSEAFCTVWSFSKPFQNSLPQKPSFLVRKETSTSIVDIILSSTLAFKAVFHSTIWTLADLLPFS